MRRFAIKLIDTDLPGVRVLEPRVFGDSRGYFLESFNAKKFAEATGIETDFFQDNLSRSQRGVLRGLHYQIQQPQDKLVAVVRGRIFDVAVDIRRSSPSFGRWIGVELSDENHRQIWVPAGFAHGFLVLSETADVMYKTTDYYAPQYERTIRWNDARLGIDWPSIPGMAEPLVSDKDKVGATLEAAELFP